MQFCISNFKDTQTTHRDVHTHTDTHTHRRAHTYTHKHTLQTHSIMHSLWLAPPPPPALADTHTHTRTKTSFASRGHSFKAMAEGVWPQLGPCGQDSGLGGLWGSTRSCPVLSSLRSEEHTSELQSHFNIVY